MPSCIKPRTLTNVSRVSVWFVNGFQTRKVCDVLCCKLYGIRDASTANDAMYVDVIKMFYGSVSLNIFGYPASSGTRRLGFPGTHLHCCSR